ncbi:MAG: tetratricopeptide repeat protein [Cyclobacteriaceae bacterium]|nr:tetratricopeptide repeat protein [Cyclobacteriaceae bacterium HetDA_MAG_MS6]
MQLLLISTFLVLLNILPFSGLAEDRWIKEGKAAMSSWQYEKAIIYFSQAIQEESNSVESYLLRSKTYLALQKYQEAEKDLQKAYSIDPKYVQQYFKRKEVARYIRIENIRSP